jgi:hypothetical protein
MRIQGPKDPAPVAPGRRADKPAEAGRGEAFARLLTPGETSPPAAASGTRPVPGVNPLFTVEAIGDEPQRRRRNRQRAEGILDRLDDIRHGLLLGVIPGDALTQLIGSLAQARETVSDPNLLEVLDEIDLRAQVELAKLDMERESQENRASDGLNKV